MRCNRRKVMNGESFVSGLIIGKEGSDKLNSLKIQLLL